jgi:N-acetylglutamate synthase-like GNAT family acetyltransferase
MVFQIRKLRPSDRVDITEISRHVWEGRDYLPGVAEEWLKDKNCYFYGVVCDGHVVAVGNLRLLENGRTGWMEGLRVHPDCRGKGYANEITRYLVRKAEELGVRRLRYTTGDENVASLKLADMAGFSRLLEMSVLWSVNPKTAPRVGDYYAVEKTTPAGIYELLQADPGIVPRGILVYDWKAVDSELKNLEEIGKTHGFYVALNSGKIDSFSFGHLRQEFNRTWSFTMYARDSVGFLAQLSYNLRSALKQGCNLIMFTFDKRFEESVEQVNLQSDEQDLGHLVLFEKQIQRAK